MLFRKLNPFRSYVPLQKNRTIFGFIEHAFNAVDFDRLETVGPDRLCAEWILKNGGAVRITTASDTLIRDYNDLPDESVEFYVTEVDATKSAITAIGFDHFQNCKHIESIKLDRCNHMSNEGLPRLIHVRQTLTTLQISRCYNVKDSGLRSIGNLVNLRRLIVYGLIAVKNVKAIEEELKHRLPDCRFDVRK